MTEGYIWTDIYPESKRIIEKGNNQSMELDDEKISDFLQLKYHSIKDAKSKLGDVQTIRNNFIQYQKYLYN